MGIDSQHVVRLDISDTGLIRESEDRTKPDRLERSVAMYLGKIGRFYDERAGHENILYKVQKEAR